MHDSQFTINQSLCIVHCAFLLLCITSSAQVLCIKCYNQNARVLTDTNNLIVNGGFENGCAVGGYFCPNSQGYSCDITYWTCLGGGSNTYSDIRDTIFSTIVEGDKAAWFGNHSCSSCSSIQSDTSCISNMGCEVTGIPVGYPVNASSGYGGDTGVSLQQIVNGLTIGSIYKLEFWAGGQSGFNKKGLFAVDLGFGNIFLNNSQTPPMNFGGGIGTRYIIAFTATSSSHSIKFTNWGQICDSCTDLVLDDVRLFKSDSINSPCANAINDLPENTIATVFPNPATTLLTITITPPPGPLKGESASYSPLGAGVRVKLFFTILLQEN